ncbi:MAG: response regulator transcription factor [Chloroflexota bacterium]
MDADGGSDRFMAHVPARPTVLVVEPFALYADCLRLALETGGFTVVGQPLTVEEVVSQLANQVPAAILCDLDLPAGRHACRALARRFPTAVIIALSGHDSPEALLRAQANGAATLVSKYDRLPTLLATLNDMALNRTTATNAEPEGRPRHRAEVAPLAPLQTLSTREREVARLIGHGLTNKEVARLMRIAPVTVRNHLSNAMSKLGARSRAEVAAMVALAGWLNDTGDQ